MMITEDFISRFAGNPATAKNGRGLAQGSHYLMAGCAEDGGVLFAVCRGGGERTYRCSVDLRLPETPRAYCSCPSRQSPCKHAVGLLYKYLLSGPFPPNDLPDGFLPNAAPPPEFEELSLFDALPRQDAPPAMSVGQAQSALKKCRSQLEGLRLAREILNALVLQGFASLTPEIRQDYFLRLVALQSLYIPGVRDGLSELLLLSAPAAKSGDFTMLRLKAEALHTLIDRSGAYLERKAELLAYWPHTDGWPPPAMLQSAIEEQLGHVWTLSELRRYGLFQEQLPLIQLGLERRLNLGARSWVDEGIWAAPSTGGIYKTRNHRPFGKQKHVRQEDSFFSALTPTPLYIYPEGPNPRVRWSSARQRPLEPDDTRRLLARARRDLSKVLGEAKRHLADPLGDPSPVYMLHVSNLLQEEQGGLILLGGDGARLPLREHHHSALISGLSPEQIIGQGLACRLECDPSSGRLYALPIAAVTHNDIIRFTG